MSLTLSTSAARLPSDCPTCAANMPDAAARTIGFMNSSPGPASRAISEPSAVDRLVTIGLPSFFQVSKVPSTQSARLHA